MHNQHRSPDPTKIERATATSTVALFLFFLYVKHVFILFFGLWRTKGVTANYYEVETD